MKQPYNTKVYNTALYLRLSRDDELQGDSSSIQTQRMMLRQYASEHGLTVVDEYVDDGWSGTNFNRPDFQRMINDIEEGKINCVVTKDLSRLGRNYILTGQYTELYFPSKGVRYIAINDNVDTASGESEIAPFLNILNEMQARQTSKKVKAAMKARAENGAHNCAYAPIGYKKDPEHKGKLIVDEEHRWIVEKIFDLADQGVGAAKITKTLITEKVPTPGWLKFQTSGAFAHIYAGQSEEKAYMWTIGQVKNILKDETYIGNTLFGKQGPVSFKNKKKVRRPRDEWSRVENTQEAIIREEVFYHVQEQIAKRRRAMKDGKSNIFAGLVKCADCGWSHVYGENTSHSRPYGYYRCSKYGQGIKLCSMHYIRYDVLYPYVLSRIQYWYSKLEEDEDKLFERLSKASDQVQRIDRKQQTSNLKKAERRKADVDKLFAKLYEDWSAGRISDYNFNMLSEKYQKEQLELEAKIGKLQEALNTVSEAVTNAGKWITLLKESARPKELTAQLLNKLIDAIYIGEAIKRADGSRDQEIRISYRFVGRID